jgi:hypothetical protein
MIIHSRNCKRSIMGGSKQKNNKRQQKEEQATISKQKETLQ